MTDERTVDRLIVHLRSHVAELRRMEREGARDADLEDRRRVINRLQRRLAYSVIDLLDGPRRPLLG